MTDDSTPTGASGPETPRATPFELIGGAGNLRALIDRFYDLMELEPDFAELRAMHPATLDGSRDKLYWFLTGWLGGPNEYIDRYGHPMLRARHLPYPIDIRARDQWLHCMDRALHEQGAAGGFPDDFRRQLMQALAQTADHMRNRAG